MSNEGCESTKAVKGGVVVMNQRNKVWSGGMKRFLICTGLALVLMGMVIPSGLAHAQGGRVKPEMVFPEHYPYSGFHGMGYILEISKDVAVIDDKVFAISPDVAYHTLEIENASRTFFRPGMRVGYLLDSEGKIKSLWLIE
jgi:hypothetical protein